MRLTLRASPVLALATASAHGAAVAIFWIFLPPAGGACAALLIIVLAFLAIKDRALLRGASSPAWLELERGGQLLAGLRNGRQIASQVSARRYVSRWLVVLRLERAPMRQRTILVARDMLPAGDFRHLRLWALWDALPAMQPVRVQAHGAR